MNTQAAKVLLLTTLAVALAAGPPADLVITNGRVWLGGSAFAEALAVRGGRLILLGSNRQALRLAGKRTLRLDAHGGSVLPGLLDAHVHLLSGGLALQRADLAAAKTLAETQTLLRAYAEAHPERPWILGRGWVYSTFPGGLPTKAQLDAAVPDRPAYLRAFDGHTAWANSRALALAGIRAATPDPPGGTIVRDPTTGEPTGALKETAQRLLDPVLPQPTSAEKLEALRAAIHEAHRVGLTGVGEAGLTAEDFELFRDLLRRGELRLRVSAALRLEPDAAPTALESFARLCRGLPPNPYLHLGAVKLFLDGVVEAHTAYLLAPYADQPGRGQPQWAPERYRTTVRDLDRAGWQVWTHAIGDGAVRLALDALEGAEAANPARARRHRIEHAETVDPADIPRFGRLGVIASQQPLHGSPEDLGPWSAALGPERAGRGWIYGSLRAAGARLAFGSDWPVVTLDPRLGMRQALTRTDLEGRPAGGWLPGERLPLPAVLEAYTSGAAWALGEEGRLGRLALGRPADLVVFDQDLFALPAEAMLRAKVAATVFAGRVVYTAKARP